MNKGPSGFALLRKTAGMTSFQTLGGIKKKVRPSKVGHTGTLDKFAEGLLVVVIGTFTKFASYITGLPKQYFATFEFGKETDTLDPEGEVLRDYGRIPEQNEIEEVLGRFTGEMEQIPPVFSAVHLDGRRASDMARNGEKPVMKPRTVTVYGIEMLSYDPPFLRVRIDCSKGTYVRSLVRDIAEECGSFGYVTRLERTKVGDFSLSDAVTADEFDTGRHIISPADFFKEIDFVRSVRIKNGYAGDILQGKKMRPEIFEEEIPAEGLYAVFDVRDDFLALIESADAGFEYKFVGRG